MAFFVVSVSPLSAPAPMAPAMAAVTGSMGISFFPVWSQAPERRRSHPLPTTIHENATGEKGQHEKWLAL
jgi:hypothetical protein